MPCRQNIGRLERMRNWTGLKKWLTRATLGWVVVTLLLGASGGIVPLEAGSGPYPKLFGTREINSHNLKAFSKWRGMLKRYFKTDQIPEGNCDERTFNTCHLEKWQAFLDSTRHLSATSRRQQIGRVNRSLNSIRHRLPTGVEALNEVLSLVAEQIRAIVGLGSQRGVGEFVTLVGSEVEHVVNHRPRVAVEAQAQRVWALAPDGDDALADSSRDELQAEQRAIAGHRVAIGEDHLVGHAMDLVDVSDKPPEQVEGVATAAQDNILGRLGVHAPAAQEVGDVVQIVRFGEED